MGHKRSVQEATDEEVERCIQNVSCSLGRERGREMEAGWPAECFWFFFCFAVDLAAYIFVPISLNPWASLVLCVLFALLFLVMACSKR